MNEKCKHKWVDMEDGTLDKFCVRCSQKARQAVALLPQPEIKVEISVPSVSLISQGCSNAGGTDRSLTNALILEVGRKMTNAFKEQLDRA